MLESKERGKEAWLAAEVEEEEVIEDNPAFQHPLILPQLFLFGCLAVEDICGSQSQCEKKKKQHFPQSNADLRRLASGNLILANVRPRVPAAARARGRRSQH